MRFCDLCRCEAPDRGVHICFRLGRTELFLVEGTLVHQVHGGMCKPAALCQGCFTRLVAEMMMGKINACCERSVVLEEE